MFYGGNVYSALKEAEIFLRSRGLCAAGVDAEVLLSFVLQVRRSKLPFIRDQKLTCRQKSQYEECILRRSEREPAAYITGFAGFMDFEFKVNKSVLIPRPETEVLVETVLKFSKSENSMLDLCTGSGCIAVSLSKLGKFKSIVGSDIDAEAIVVAEENGKLNGVLNIDFVESDIFSGIGGKKFDVIVSNPPYVSFEEYDFLEPELKYEPKAALTAPDEGLFFYREIVQGCRDYLKSGGFVFVELNANKAGEIKQIFLDGGYKNVEVVKDYGGLPRVLKAESMC